jgi:hypothetical protein
MLLLLGGEAIGQTSNPFELTPRLSQQDTQAQTFPLSDSTASISNNPFDIINTPVTRKNNPRPVQIPAPSELPEESKSLVFRFGLVIFILSMLAFLLTILRNIAIKSFQAFLNNNMLNQLYRDQEGRGISPFLLLYAMFLTNLGIFLFFSLDVFGIRLADNSMGMFLLCLAGSVGLFMGKHFLLSLVSFIFPVSKEISKYHFLIIVYGIVIGFMLVPVNLFLAFGSEGVLKQVVYGMLVLIALVYAYRYFRAMAIASKFLVFHKFHFLLYICTIEITPAIIILKLAQSGI